MRWAWVAYFADKVVLPVGQVVIERGGWLGQTTEVVMQAHADLMTAAPMRA